MAAAQLRAGGQGAAAAPAAAAVEWPQLLSGVARAAQRLQPGLSGGKAAAAAALKVKQLRTRTVAVKQAQPAFGLLCTQAAEGMLPAGPGAEMARVGTIVVLLSRVSGAATVTELSALTDRWRIPFEPVLCRTRAAWRALSTCCNSKQAAAPDADPTRLWWPPAAATGNHLSRDTRPPLTTHQRHSTLQTTSLCSRCITERLNVTIFIRNRCSPDTQSRFHSSPSTTTLPPIASFYSQSAAQLVAASAQ